MDKKAACFEKMNIAKQNNTNQNNATGKAVKAVDDKGLRDFLKDYRNSL